MSHVWTFGNISSFIKYCVVFIVIISKCIRGYRMMIQLSVSRQQWRDLVFFAFQFFLLSVSLAGCLKEWNLKFCWSRILALSLSYRSTNQEEKLELQYRSWFTDFHSFVSYFHSLNFLWLLCTCSASSMFFLHWILVSCSLQLWIRVHTQASWKEVVHDLLLLLSYWVGLE